MTLDDVLALARDAQRRGARADPVLHLLQPDRAVRHGALRRGGARGGRARARSFPTSRSKSSTRSRRRSRPAGWRFRCWSHRPRRPSAPSASPPRATASSTSSRGSGVTGAAARARLRLDRRRVARLRARHGSAAGGRIRHLDAGARRGDRRDRRRRDRRQRVHRRDGRAAGPAPPPRSARRATIARRSCAGATKEAAPPQPDMSRRMPTVILPFEENSLHAKLRSVLARRSAVAGRGLRLSSRRRRAPTIARSSSARRSPPPARCPRRRALTAKATTSGKTTSMRTAASKVGGKKYKVDIEYCRR